MPFLLQKMLFIYGVTSFPMHIVINKNSNITFAVNGLGPTTIDDLDKMIGSLLN
jgi:hypothetical protein